MSSSIFTRWAGLTCMLGGAAWMVAVPLIATAASTEPVGTGYDAYNRLLTLPLLLLLAGWATVYGAQAGRLGKLGRRSAVAVLVGWALMLTGNVTEFWGAVLQSKPNSATAERLGVEAWVGSNVGFALFAVGTLIVLVSTPLFGVATKRAGVLPRWSAYFIATSGLLAITAAGLWAVSVGAAAVVAALFGLGWVGLGYALRADKEHQRLGQQVTTRQAPG